MREIDDITITKSTFSLILYSVHAVFKYFHYPRTIFLMALSVNPFVVSTRVWATFSNYFVRVICVHSFAVFTKRFFFVLYVIQSWSCYNLLLIFNILSFANMSGQYHRKILYSQKPLSTHKCCINRKK